MKKARHVLGLLLAVLLSLSILPSNLVRADSTNTNDKVIETVTENTKVDKIINEYLQGIYDSEESINFRKKLVENNNLQEQVDEDYFFKDELLNSLIDDEAIGDKITLVKLSKKDSALDDVYEMPDTERSDIIKNILSEVESESISVAPKRVRRAAVFNAPSVGARITNEGNLIYHENGIMMGRTDKFNINGVIAFCADHSKTPPGTGVKITSVRVEGNSLIRKILYYGFKGPGQISGWSSDGLRVATSMAISQVRNGDGMNLGKRLVNQVQGLAEPPAEFIAYMATLDGSHYQNIAFWELKQVPKKGKIKIQKKSMNEVYTKGNNNYSLGGAKFGVYTDIACTNQVGTLITNEDGWSNELEVEPITHYIKELVAPKGFFITTSVFSVNVVPNQTTTQIIGNNPISDPISILVKKINANDGSTDGMLGAEFTIKFYAGEYQDNVNPAMLGVNPTRIWILKTDKDGFTMLDDISKVSGDDFYRMNDGTPTLPLGTITIQETKSPNGFKINPEIIARKITTNFDNTTIVKYNTPTIKEESIDFQIKKVQIGTDIGLPGVKFRHTKPDGSTEDLVTGNDGTINMKAVTRGLHRVVEVDTISGYILNGNEFAFEVTQDNKINVLTDVNNKDMSYKDVNGNGYLTVANKPNNYSFKIVKVNDKGAKLEGAEFTMYSDEECKNVIKTIKTNREGIVLFDNLIPEVRYYYKETNPAKGYKLPKDNKVHEVYATAVPVRDQFILFVDGKGYISSTQDGSVIIEGNKENRVGGVTIVNEIQMKLPETGSNLMFPILIVGAFLICSALFLSHKSKVKNLKVK